MRYIRIITIVFSLIIGVIMLIAALASPTILDYRLSRALGDTGTLRSS